MIQLAILNDQAEAVLPELEKARASCVKQLTELHAGNNAAEETRLTRALAVLGALVGQIRAHLTLIHQPAPRRSDT